MREDRTRVPAKLTRLGRSSREGDTLSSAEQSGGLADIVPMESAAREISSLDQARRSRRGRRRRSIRQALGQDSSTRHPTIHTSHSRHPMVDWRLNQESEPANGENVLMLGSNPELKF